jgi:serine/threonine-protein kinase
MGRVYRARDPRLDRDVAIKVLPSVFAADTERLRRFELEARASGASTHPNLVTVYDVGTIDGRPFLVTEFLDGETLRDRLDRGAVTAVRACEIAAALARGLAAAHAKGIVHRDLKPENVMLTRDGRIKILDFGVAKLRSADSTAARADAPPRGQTESGVIVGTAGYMAPEQIRGADADGRADLFALGAILFELLTGRRAFDRLSRAETLDSTVHHDPMAGEPQTQAWPPAIRRIVQRCLEKDPEARFQSAADLAFALETAFSHDAAASTVTARRARPSALVLIAAAALLLGAGAAVGIQWRTASPPSDGDTLVRFALPLGEQLRLTGTPVVSPDGMTIAYPAYEGTVESRKLYVRRIDQVSGVGLPGTERAASPFFSPDGEWVAFWADDRLKRTRLDGTAPPVIVCAVESFLGGTWTAEGTILFSTAQHGVQQVNAAGGAPAPFGAVEPAAPTIEHHAPELLPGGRAALVTVREREQRFRIDVVVASTGARHTIVEDGFDGRYLSTGHIIYASGQALFAVPFDLERLRTSGPAVQLLDGVATDRSDGNAPYSLASNGTLIFMPQVPSPRRSLAWVDRAGRTTPLPLEPRAYWTPRLSPDATMLAVVVEELGVRQIWVYHLANRTFTRLTLQGDNWSPVWSRDGAHLFHASQRDGQWLLVREALDGRGAPDLLLTSAHQELTPGGLSADGRSLVYVARSANGNGELQLLDLERRQSSPIGGAPARVGMPVVSPDGRWLGLTAWTPSRPSIYLRHLAGDGSVRQLFEGAGYTVWNRTGDRVYFRSRRGATGPATADGVFELPIDRLKGVATGPATELFRLPFVDWLGVPGFDIAPDGRFLLVLHDERESPPRNLNVLLHVDDEVRRRTAAARR